MAGRICEQAANLEKIFVPLQLMYRIFSCTKFYSYNFTLGFGSNTRKFTDTTTSFSIKSLCMSVSFLVILIMFLLYIILVQLSIAQDLDHYITCCMSSARFWMPCSKYPSL